MSSTSTMATATTPSASVTVPSMAQHQQLKPAAVNGQQVSWHRSHCVRMICLFNQYIVTFSKSIHLPSSLSLSIHHTHAILRRWKFQHQMLFAHPLFIHLLLIASTTLSKVWYYWFELSTYTDANSNNNKYINNSSISSNKHIIIDNININIGDCIGRNDIQTSDAFQSISQHIVWRWCIDEFSEFFKSGAITSLRSNCARYQLCQK